MRSIFCGNLESDARQSDVERLFRKYGKVERVDMKSGFAFINMEEERDADDAIRRLDRIEFGRAGRRLRVEWTKQERGGRRPLSPKRSSARTVPSKTLFVINFDPVDTKTSDLERHFDPFGRILNVRIRRNFAFVQYESQEDATKALEEMHLSKFMDRVISVKYAVGDNDDRRRGRDASPDRRGRDASSPSPDRRGRDASPYRRGRDASPDRRGRDASPDRRGYGRGRSPDLYRRDRGSPDYGHGSVPNSRTEPRGSPHYDGIAKSPVNDRSRSHSPLPRERSRS